MIGWCCGPAVLIPIWIGLSRVQAPSGGGGFYSLLTRGSCYGNGGALGHEHAVTLSIGPVFALIWYGLIHSTEGSRLEKYRLLSFNVVRSLSTYRNEVLLFSAANMFGAGMAVVLPSGDMSAALNNLVPWPDAKIILLMVTFLVASAVGLHPIIVVIAVSAVFPPSSLGLDDRIMALALVGAWGVSTMVSPFSGTTLFMSPIANVPGHVIGWCWSPPMV